jgi:NitT/TauT family transport system substrate-binding protein
MTSRVVAVVIAVLATLSVGCNPTPSSPRAAPAASTSPVARLPLRLGLASSPAPGLPNSVLWLAKDLGFYEREGLDVDLTELSGSPTVLAALQAGELDVGNIGTEDVLRVVSTKSIDVRAIHSPDDRQYFLIAARDTLGSMSDLSGKNFGIARLGSLDYTMSLLVFHVHGLPNNAVTFVGLGDPGTRAQALVAGRVDATTVSVATWASIKRQPGVKVLLNAEDYFNAAPIVQKVNAAMTKTVVEKGEHLRRFTAAIVKISRLFADDQNAWVDAMAKRRTDLVRDDLADLWTQFHGGWAVNGEMNLDHYQRTAEFLYATEPFQGVPKIGVNEWADTRFVDAVLRELGLYPGFDEPGRAL